MPHEDLIEATIHGFAKLSEAVNQRGLKFLHQNIRSLRGKMDELTILVSHCPNLHLLAFTETWLDNSISYHIISYIFIYPRIFRVAWCS